MYQKDMSQSIILLVSIQIIHKVTGGFTWQTLIIGDSNSFTSSYANKANYYYAKSNRVLYN